MHFYHYKLLKTLLKFFAFTGSFGKLNTNEKFALHASSNDMQYNHSRLLIIYSI
jgi:hypothetical protein